MKVIFHPVFLVICLVMLGSLTAVPAYSQYESDPTSIESKDLNPEGNTTSDEKSGVTERDTRVHASRDSAHLHTPATVIKAKGPEQAKPSSTKEEDALSFNFLYYIIQKFKISDLIDD
jgi:hypothetical protein